MSNINFVKRDQKVIRQDKVDNAIATMVESIMDRDVSWDVEIMGLIRDKVLDTLAEFYNVEVEELYLSLEEE